MADDTNTTDPAAADAREAAPDAAKAKVPKLPKDHVWATVTKAGDGQVHTGGAPGETHPRGARIAIHKDSVASLEARHFVEAD